VSLREITDRKEALEKLNESEIKLRNLFDNMSSGVAVYEAIDNGNNFIIKDFNKAGEQISKVTKEEVIGKRIYLCFPQYQESRIV
jgi:PAS domain-containing protein